MAVALILALVGALAFAALAPALGRRLPPATATRLLVPASALVAGSTVFVLGAAAFTWMGQFPEVAEEGSWSPAALGTLTPIPAAPAALCALLLLLAAAWATIVAVRHGRAVVDVHRMCRHQQPVGGLVVVDSPLPDAFATPQPAGRIVVTTGLLRALTPAERRIVLAHEASHLAHRHAWWIMGADLAAAVNPLLRPTARTVAHGAERWADEDAASDVGDRRCVARTVARVALLRQAALRGQTTGSAGPAATGGNVPDRVRALLAPPPPRRPAVVASLVALLIATGLATTAVQHTGEELFEQAATGHPPAAATTTRSK